MKTLVEFVSEALVNKHTNNKIEYVLAIPITDKAYNILMDNYADSLVPVNYDGESINGYILKYDVAKDFGGIETYKIPDGYTLQRFEDECSINKIDTTNLERIEL